MFAPAAVRSSIYGFCSSRKQKLSIGEIAIVLSVVMVVVRLQVDLRLSKITDKEAVFTLNSWFRQAAVSRSEK